ncbi:hypothetical protein Tco_0387613, partial [Tanacetum coccineum]
TGKIFNTVGLRWVPTENLFASNTTKVDSEPTNDLNEDITNQYECEQTLDARETRASRNFHLMHKDDVCSQQFRPQNSMSNDVCSQQFRPQTSMSNDV